MKTLNRMLVWAVAMFAYLVLSWSSWAESPTLQYMRNTSGFSNSYGGTTYTFWNKVSAMLRYNLKNTSGTNWLSQQTGISVGSWTGTGMDTQTDTQLLYFEFDGGWNGPDIGEILLLSKVYVPNDGYYYYPLGGVPQFATWGLAVVYFNDSTGNYSHYWYQFGYESTPYQWNVAPWAFMLWADFF